LSDGCRSGSDWPGSFGGQGSATWCKLLGTEDGRYREFDLRADGGRPRETLCNGGKALEVDIVIRQWPSRDVIKHVVSGRYRVGNGKRLGLKQFQRQLLRKHHVAEDKLALGREAQHF
jgi:hypothetical protein